MVNNLTDKITVLHEIEKITTPSRQGNNYRCECPIHGGKNRTAFTITEDGTGFYCFSCGAKGNVIDFVMQYYDLTENDAIEYLNNNYDTSKLKPIEKITYEPRDKSEINFISEHIKLVSSVARNRDRVFGLLSELFGDFFETEDYRPISKFIGYDSKLDTLTVSVLSNDNRVVNIKSRIGYNKEGELVKWKSMYNADGDYPLIKNTNKNRIFVASGMAEFLILEILGFDYVVTQADLGIEKIDMSVFKNKEVYVFEDNDRKEKWAENKFREKVTNKIKEYRILVPFDFENVLDRHLPKGYDLRDFIHDVKPKEFIRLIDNEIKYFNGDIA